MELRTRECAQRAPGENANADGNVMLTDDYPPRQPFVKLLTWAPCAACDLQVHAPLTRFLLQGLVCPSCGARLLEAPGDPSEQLSEVLRREDLISAEIE
jgi:hypothetical protein